MKKLMLSLVIVALVSPSFAWAETAPAPAAAIPHSATVEAVQDKAAATPIPETAPAATAATPAPAAKTKKAGGPKVCNPKKSKPCGKGCIPLARTCKKK